MLNRAINFKVSKPNKNRAPNKLAKLIKKSASSKSGSSKSKGVRIIIKLKSRARLNNSLLRKRSSSKQVKKMNPKKLKRV